MKKINFLLDKTFGNLTQRQKILYVSILDKCGSDTDKPFTLTWNEVQRYHIYKSRIPGGDPCDRLFYEDMKALNMAGFIDKAPYNHHGPRDYYLSDAWSIDS